MTESNMYTSVLHRELAREIGPTGHQAGRGDGGRGKTTMISEQDTLPLTRIHDPRPTFRQFRTRYNVSIYDIATQAQVHLLFVYRMDCNRRIEFSIALRVLAALSHYARYTVHFDDMQSIHLKNSELAAAFAAR